MLRRLLGRSERALDEVPWKHMGRPLIFGGAGSMPGAAAEYLPEDFEHTIANVHEGHGIVSAAVMARARLSGELVFQWRDDITKRTYGTPELAILERPSPSVTRSDLLRMAELDVCYHGNAYLWRTRDDHLVRLRPDWVDLIIESDILPDEPGFAEDAQVSGFVFHRGGRRRGKGEIFLDRREVAHWRPEPHPTRVGIGASWITSLVNDMIADDYAEQYIRNYFKNGTASHLAVGSPPSVTTPEQFKEWAEEFKRQHEGTQWRNVYVSAGTDVTPISASLKDLDVASLRGGFENRVAVRSGVHPVILGTRESLQGSALNAGNYASARRAWGDVWLDTSGNNLCAALETVAAPPRASSLTFDRSRILFLQEDQKDEAEIMQSDASALQTLINAGYKPEQAAAAVAARDISLLASPAAHTGLSSVQLVPPGDGS